jgi:tRNA dimethylallyltransferase
MPQSIKSTRPWIVLVGPTGVGKTSVAEQIAEAFNTDIIVADSRQVYQGMDIATNKPTADDQERIRRHLINLVLPNASFSAGAYKKEADLVIATLTKNGKPILIEGGTGLYIKAILHGLWEGPPKNMAIRESILEMGQEEGVLYQKLIEVDPVSAQKIHFNDRYKIGRALEVFYATGRPISSFHAEHQFLSKPKNTFLIIGLRRIRSDLFHRIEARVDQQFQDGLIAEITETLEKGHSLELPAMRALGVLHVISYIQGRQTLAETVSLLKRDTRHYAKRQMTWFSANPNIFWIDLKVDESPLETFERIAHLLYKEENGS